MRPFAVLAIVLVSLGVGMSSAAGTQGRTSLTVTYWEDGSRPAGRVVWTLRCNPPRGTLARLVVACRRLSVGGSKLFSPLPKNIVCTEIYGGPQKASIVGTVAGTRIWATFTRQNGCHIERWGRVSPWLLPPGGVTS